MFWREATGKFFKFKVGNRLDIFVDFRILALIKIILSTRKESMMFGELLFVVD